MGTMRQAPHRGLYMYCASDAAPCQASGESEAREVKLVTQLESGRAGMLRQVCLVRKLYS